VCVGGPEGKSPARIGTSGKPQGGATSPIVLAGVMMMINDDDKKERRGFCLATASPSRLCRELLRFDRLCCRLRASVWGTGSPLLRPLHPSPLLFYSYFKAFIDQTRIQPVLTDNISVPFLCHRARGAVLCGVVRSTRGGGGHHHDRAIIPPSSMDPS